MDPSTALANVVLPELARVFRHGEIRAIEICVATHRGDEWEPAQDVLELTVTAGPKSETFGVPVRQSVVMAGWTAAQVRKPLREDLVDFVAQNSSGGVSSEVDLGVLVRGVSGPGRCRDVQFAGRWSGSGPRYACRRRSP